MAISADLLRGYTETIIMKQLTDGDSYGYGINKRISEISQGGLEFKEATLYTAFKRLEAGGLIRSYWGDEGSGARRRYYSLTETGQEKLNEDQRNWGETRALLTKLIEGEEK